MKLTPQERAHNRAAFREMSPAQRREYIFTYYKPQLLLAAAVLLALVLLLRSALTRRDTVLCAALVNISIGSDLEQSLTTDYLLSRQLSPKRCAVELYKSLALTDDPSSEAYQYVYASRIKLLSAIESRQLDVVLLNREAYDALSQSGYLAELSPLVAQDDPLAPYLAKNLVILEDNAVEHALDESVAYDAVTREDVNAVSAAASPLLQSAGFGGEVYLAVIANTPRTQQALDYIRYLCQNE